MTNPIQIHDIISSRRSPVAFSDRKIEPEKIAGLFEAARWAPSSYNEQPWRFIYAVRENLPQFTAMLDCLVEANRIWARNAYLLVLSIARMVLSRDGKPNRYAFHDVGLAVGNLIAQASSMGLMVHQMGGYSTDKARDVLAIPREFEPVAMIAIGYPGNIDELPEDLRRRELQPRVRRDLSEIVFENIWKG
ncbi:MAG: nitroreductase family protein [Bacteroidales bacterium]|nr:MAG: nitroreductase family protein [Bacteroidales bacterium]